MRDCVAVAETSVNGGRSVASGIRRAAGRVRQDQIYRDGIHGRRPRLPTDFAMIPDDHPTESVRASVPGTPQAQEEAARRIVDGITRFGVHYFYHGTDQGTWREVLSCARLHVFGGGEAAQRCVAGVVIPLGQSIQ